ncbi:hypothetical protein ABC733_26620 [Mangrovibacter sp. SLW1]
MPITVNRHSTDTTYKHSPTVVILKKNDLGLKMGNSRLRRNTFKIVVTMDNNSGTTTPETHDLKYKFSKSYLDKLEINDNVITISGSRYDKPNFDDIFINNQSEIYLQIIKSYIYYCISNGDIYDILEIKCYNKNNVLEKNTLAEVYATFGQKAMQTILN